MSEDAAEYMRRIGKLYFDAKFPNHRVWLFDGGKDTPVHRELQAYGLIEVLGTRGASYVLTDAGKQWILDNRAEIES